MAQVLADTRNSFPDSALPPTIGRYRIHEELGRGGMGVVYRAVDTGTGDELAIKTVAVPNERVITVIRREIHALSSINHPGVVRIVAHGVAHGRPWYAMPLLKGRTFRSMLREHITGATTETRASPEHSTRTVTSTGLEMRASAPPDWPETPHSPRGDDAPGYMRFLSLLSRLCETLAFLHGHGIVHRDLKPENIMLREDGAPVLVDFGIASRSGALYGREVLDAAGELTGTLSYIAPEQIRGEFVDARADLYALGCILYECVVGHPPFQDASRSARLQGHLSRAPLPPSQLVSGVPPQLEGLILRLLAKQPYERLGHASDVAAVLKELGVQGAPEPEPAPTPAYLYRPRFLGRGESLQRILGQLDRARKGAGGFTLLGGESGIGKTRLAMEVATAARTSGFQVILGECTPLGGGGPQDAASREAPLQSLRTLLQAVADRCRTLGPEESAHILGLKARLLAPYEPGLMELPGLEHLPEPPPLPPPAARQRLLEAIRDTLLSLSKRGPVLLVLDDLQWADELSLLALGLLARSNLEGTALYVLGTYRTEEMTPQLRALLDMPQVSQLRIGHLDSSMVHAMVGGMLALGEPPTLLLDFLDGQCRGNPFFVAEYLRAAMSEGLLYRDRLGQWHFEERSNTLDSLGQRLGLPRSLRELIVKRIAGLSATARQLVELAAVFGREFDEGLLISASELDEAAAMNAVDQLSTRSILEETRDGKLRFVHDKLREVTYEQLAPQRGRALHHTAARALEAHATEAQDAAPLLPSLAHHWDKAGIHDKAATYAARAGHQAKASYANDAAISLYRLALDHLAALAGPQAPRDAHRDEVGALNESLGDVLALTGQYDTARAAYTAVLDGLPSEEVLVRARLHRKMGKVWETHHRYQEALGCYERAEVLLGDLPTALEEARRAAWWHEWVQIQTDRTWVYYWLADVERMRALVEKVRPVIEAHGPALHRVKFLYSVVQLNLRGERFSTSKATVDLARAGVTASRELGNAVELIVAQFGLALALLCHGELREAESLMRAILAEGERTGDITQQARCLTYLPMITRREGRVEETEALAARALSVATKAAMADYIGAARANLAWVAWRRGNRDEARQGASAALELWRSLSLIYPFQWTALFHLLALDCEAGALAEASGRVHALIDPRQQRLPQELERLLQTCAALDLNQEDSLRDLLREAVQLGDRWGYL